MASVYSRDHFRPIGDTSQLLDIFSIADSVAATTTISRLAVVVESRLQLY